MTQSLKIECLVTDLALEGEVASFLVTKEQLTAGLSKKADLVEGKIQESNLPDFIANSFQTINQKLVTLEESIADGIQSAKDYSEAYANEKLIVKADLVDGKVPKTQLPSVEQYEGLSDALNGVLDQARRDMIERTDEIQRSKADLGEDGKVVRVQLPNYDKIPGLETVVTDLYDSKANAADVETSFKESQDQLDAHSLLLKSMGSILPYNPSNTYAEGYVTLKDGILQQLVSGNWIPFKINALNAVDASGESQQQVNYNGGSKWHYRDGGYQENERAVLDNGNIVKSTVDGNVNDPNSIMTGWLNISNAGEVESITELLKVSNPKNGQVVYVKSYNAGQGEGGDVFIYKSSRQLENDGVSVFNGWERQKNGKPWTLEDAGKLRNSTSDSLYLQKVLDLSKEKHTNIILKPNTTYIFKDKAEVTDSKGITLIAYGAKTLIGYHQETPNDNYQYPFAITCDPNSNASVIIKGLNQDGAPSFYNPWEYFTAGKRWYSVVGIKIESAFNVVYEGVTQKNILGYGSQWFDCKNVSVDGFDAKEVGGHNGLFGNDSIGDCFYIGWRSDNTKYVFKNVSAKGVSVEDIYSGSYYSPRSRIFIAVENLKPSAIDVQTNISLENVKAFDYQRGIHVEANKGEVLLTGDNVDIKADLVCLSSHTIGESKFSFTNSYLTPDTRDYNGTGGINWGVDLFLGAGCVVDDINRNSKTVNTGLLSHKAGNAKFGTMLGKGSRVKNIKGLLANGGKYSADGAAFEFSESYSSYYHYNSARPVLNNCELINIENTAIKRMSIDQAQFILKGCTVRNLDFGQSVYESPVSNLYLSSALAGYSAQVASGRVVNFYLDNVLKSRYDDVLAVNAQSTYVSVNELAYTGKYYVTKALTELPTSVTTALIETQVTNKRGFSGYSDDLMQTCTSLVAPYTISRRFRSNTTWSAWV